MHRLTVVDAFTARPFAGNPAAICLLSQPADEQWMRNIAVEMNLAETAFLMPEQDGYRLRWLTPETEVDLCGHATLASAHLLWTDGHQPAGSEIRFYTRSGLLTARQEDGMIWLDFPAKPAREAPDPGGLVAALGAKASLDRAEPVRLPGRGGGRGDGPRNDPKPGRPCRRRGARYHGDQPRQGG